MKHLIKRFFANETLSYLFFGVMTTVINYAVFWLLITVFGDGAALWVNCIAFVAAVTFAYLTNKIFVFRSKSWERRVLLRELTSFLTARILSFLFEELGLWICTQWLHVEQYTLLGVGDVMIAKIILSVIVVVINYVLSKFIIFKPREK